MVAFTRFFCTRRDVRGHLPAEKEASWVSKLIEFCQLLNAGADPAAPVEVSPVGYLKNDLK